MRSAPQVLTINFVRVSAGIVTGTIDPYRSPDCSCLLLTVFRGRLTGERIEGEFVSRHSEHLSMEQKGTWWATRVKRVVAP
jgi:hypothetical protein